MIIEKQYKFYAAHRNEQLRDKCSNIHGHRYGLRCYFVVERNGAISTLFGDFDDRIEPWLLKYYDHGMLINREDPLYESLQDHMQRTGECLKLKIFDGPTSVENLAYMMFSEITSMGLQLDRLEIQETDSSTIIYTHEDWQRDHARGLSSASSVRV